MARQFFTDIPTDGLVDGVDVSSLKTSVDTNTSNISLKANQSDLPTGTINGNEVGKLININLDTDLSIITFEFESSIVEASVSSITEL